MFFFLIFVFFLNKTNYIALIICKNYSNGPYGFTSFQIGPCGSNFNNLVHVVTKTMHGGPSIHISVKDLTEYADMSNF